MKRICIILGLISVPRLVPFPCGTGVLYSASEIIVSAQTAIYCLDSNGALKWSFSHPSAPSSVYEQSGPAIGDIDNDGSPEILVGADKLYCFSYDGNLKWSCYIDTVWLCSPVIANADTMGNPEVIVASRDTIYCLGGGGTVKWIYPITGNYAAVWIGPAVTVANVDTTLTPEVFAVTPSYVYCLDCNGNLKWSFAMSGDRYVGIAVADLNLDNDPEIVISNTKSIYCLRSDGSQKWVYNSSTSGFVSQPAIADINSDTKPEIVFYAYPKIYAFQENTVGTGLNLVWEANVEDVTGLASATPPVICDIDGDGDKDVLWVGWDNASGPMNPLYILNGLDGKHPDNSGGTCYTNDNFGARTACERGVAVADIDDDGKVEIVGISANSGDIYGVAVLECDSWADSRDLFTSHLYHISEINDNVTVPKIEPNSWQSHNTWLTQLTTGGSGFGNPILKWDYANVVFEWIVASIAIAPVYNPPSGTEEHNSPEFGNLKVFCKGNKVMVSFSLDKVEDVSIRIFDVSGRLRKVIDLGILNVGLHERMLDFSYLVNGVYFIQAHLGSRAITHKLLLVR